MSLQSLGASWLILCPLINPSRPTLCFQTQLHQSCCILALWCPANYFWYCDDPVHWAHWNPFSIYTWTQAFPTGIIFKKKKKNRRRRGKKRECQSQGRPENCEDSGHFSHSTNLVPNNLLAHRWGAAWRQCVVWVKTKHTALSIPWEWYSSPSLVTRSFQSRVRVLQGPELPIQHQPCVTEAELWLSATHKSPPSIPCQLSECRDSLSLHPI